MIGVDEMEDIRKRARGGEPIASIARAVGAPEPTVGKYAGMKDLSPEPPRRRGHESEVLAPYEETIDSRPAGGCGNRRKQRRTATRAYVRLRDEEGYTGSYSTARRYVKRRARRWPASATAGTPRGSRRESTPIPLTLH